MGKCTVTNIACDYMNKDEVSNTSLDIYLPAGITLGRHTSKDIVFSLTFARHLTAPDLH